ncbi:MAG: Gfo/Idh/MocA family oxidoreductase [Christensenella sp.]
MEKKKIRMGIIGAGLIFNRHYNGIKASPDAELAAICDMNEQALRQKAQLLAIPEDHIFTDYRKMFDSGLIDAVSICTPNNTHVEIALEALKRNIPFAIEKPVGVNDEEVQKLYDQVKKKNLKNMVCFTYRFKTAARFAKSMIESGEIGEIYHVYTEYIQDYDLRPYSLPTFWRFQKNVAGGGVVYDLGCHVMDLVTFMTGLNYESICATTENVIKTRPDPVTKEPREVTTDDYCHMLAKFTTGASAVFQISKCCIGRKNYQRIQIYGSKGAIIYTLNDKDLQDTIEVCIGKPYTDSYQFTQLDIPAEYRTDQMQSFFDILNDCGDGKAATLEDGLHAQRLITKVMESAEIRQWVDVTQI